MKLIFAQGTHTGPRLNHLEALCTFEKQVQEQYRSCRPSRAKRLEKRLNGIRKIISNYYKKL